MKLKEAEDIKKELVKIVSKLELAYVQTDRIVCFRSTGSTSKARARIWSFPKIWQKALKKPPHYVIEVLSDNFDHLSRDDKARVLIHELLHIPKNFSGSLLPHKTRYSKIDGRRINKLFSKFKKT